MDHSPQTPADDRALRLLEHANLPTPTKEVLLALVRQAQTQAAEAGEDLQAEFGREHVALIVGCNQFVRIFRSGREPGAVEILLDAPDKDKLAADGFALRDAEGQVFKLFGWTRITPTEGPEAALHQAVSKAFAKARASKKR
jgi:hypothetical protein